MVWGLEFFANFNPFEFSGINVISSILFFMIFGYLSNRATKEKPFEIALEVTAYSVLVGLILVSFGFPPLFTGIGYIIGYYLMVKYVTKQTRIDFFWMVIYISFLFIELAAIDALTRGWLLLAMIVFMVIESEVEIKRKKKEPAKK